MTFRERRLMRITKKILKLNRDTEILLTGSLMLAVRGIPKRREAKDIDIIFTDGGKFAAPNYIPIMPKGFTYVAATLDGSQTDCIKFKKGNIHVDFLYSEEEEEGSFRGGTLRFYSKYGQCKKRL